MQGSEKVLTEAAVALGSMIGKVLKTTLKQSFVHGCFYFHSERLRNLSNAMGFFCKISTYHVIMIFPACPKPHN